MNLTHPVIEINVFAKQGGKETAAHQGAKKSGWLQVCQVGKIDQRRDRSSFPINQRSVRPYGLG